MAVLLALLPDAIHAETPLKQALPLSCSGGTATDGIQLDDARRSPMFSVMQERIGSPLNCRIQDNGTARTLDVQFPAGATFTMTADEVIETSTQSATWPASAAPMTQADAVAILRKIEKLAAAPSGCGIRWSSLTQPQGGRDGEQKFIGTTCNCRAHFTRADGKIVSLGFGMAC